FGARADRSGCDRRHRDVACVRSRHGILAGCAPPDQSGVRRGRPRGSVTAVASEGADAVEPRRRARRNEGAIVTVLTPFDDYPIHQTPLPIAHPATGDPNHYDRFWFNGYTEDYYFAAGMAVYPNRGIIDGAFSVVSDGVQRSVFASGRIPHDRSQTRIGP